VSLFLPKYNKKQIKEGGDVARISKRAVRKVHPQKVCSTCQKEKSMRYFYTSYNSLHKDGKIPICKDCIKDACYNENGEFELDRFKSLLRQLDKPFIQYLWDKSQSEAIQNMGNNEDEIPFEVIIGKYLKNISLPQFRGKTWEDGFNLNFKDGLAESRIESTRRKAAISDKVYYLSDITFDVTQEIIRLFGEGYTAKEYEIMQRIYDDVKQDYPHLSNNQKSLLIRYVRFTAKEEIATSTGSIAEAEKWAKMASEALKQLNSIDVQGGISSFSEFFQQFERIQDITRILPEFKYRPNDAPDFIIWSPVSKF